LQGGLVLLGRHAQELAVGGLGNQLHGGRRRLPQQLAQFQAAVGADDHLLTAMVRRALGGVEGAQEAHGAEAADVAWWHGLALSLGGGEPHHNAPIVNCRTWKERASLSPDHFAEGKSMIERTLNDGLLTLRLAHGKASALDVELLEGLLRELEGPAA